MRGTNEKTLEQAKDWLRERINDGARCPCCEQYARAYKRKLSGGMVRTLIALYHWSRDMDKPEWCHVEQDIVAPGVVRSRCYPKLRYP